MTDAARRVRLRVSVAATVALLLADAGCHRLNRHDTPAARPARPDTPPATRPAASAALLDAAAIRERAEREEVYALANVLRLTPHTAGLRRFHHIADPLLAGAKRVVVVQYLAMNGGTSDWDHPVTTRDAESRAAADRSARQYADQSVRVWTLLLYEDADGIGFVTDFAEAPAAEQAEAAREGVAMAPLRIGEAAVTSGYWTLPVQQEILSDDGAREWADARARLRELVAGTTGVEVLRGGDSYDAAQAIVFSVTDGTRFGAAAGVNIGNWVGAWGDRSGPLGPRTLDAVGLWQSIARRARATDP
jgi:hypothetical protein